MDYKKLDAAYGCGVSAVLVSKLAHTPFPERHCCSAECARPCCHSSIPGGEMNLFEIMIVAAHLDLTPSKFFKKYMELGTDVVLRDGMVPVPNLYRVSWHLKRPCPFVEKEGRCRIALMRPLVCQMFPDAYFGLRRLLEADAESYIFELSERGFPCACHSQGKFSETALRELQHKIVIDTATSDCFFFEDTPHFIDVTGHSGEIRALMGVGVRAGSVQRSRHETLSYHAEPEDHIVHGVISRHYGAALHEEAVTRLKALEDHDNLESFFATFERIGQEFQRNFSSLVRYTVNPSDEGPILLEKPLFP